MSFKVQIRYLIINIKSYIKSRFTHTLNSSLNNLSAENISSYLTKIVKKIIPATKRLKLAEYLIKEKYVLYRTLKSELANILQTK